MQSWQATVQGIQCALLACKRQAVLNFNLRLTVLPHQK